MYKITNKLNRRIGLRAPKHGSFILEVGESKEITNDHYAELMKTPKNDSMIKAEKVSTGSKKDKGKS